MSTVCKEMFGKISCLLLEERGACLQALPKYTSPHIGRKCLQAPLCILYLTSGENERAALRLLLSFCYYPSDMGG